jgi:MFS family permease
MGLPVPVLGPVLGGWLTENYSWRYVFYINLPIGIIAFLGMTTFLSETARNTRIFANADADHAQQHGGAMRRVAPMR